MLEDIFRRGRSVDPNSEVRVGHPPKVVEIVGLVGQSGSDFRAEWEALWDDARPEISQRDLSSRFVFLFSSSVTV